MSTVEAFHARFMMRFTRIRVDGMDGGLGSRDLDTRCMKNQARINTQNVP